MYICICIYIYIYIYIYTYIYTVSNVSRPPGCCFVGKPSRLLKLMACPGLRAVMLIVWGIHKPPPYPTPNTY